MYYYPSPAVCDWRPNCYKQPIKRAHTPILQRRYHTSLVAAKRWHKFSQNSTVIGFSTPRPLLLETPTLRLLITRKSSCPNTHGMCVKQCAICFTSSTDDPPFTGPAKPTTLPTPSITYSLTTYTGRCCIPQPAAQCRMHGSSPRRHKNRRSSYIPCVPGAHAKLVPCKLMNTMAEIKPEKGQGKYRTGTMGPRRNGRAIGRIAWH